MGRTIEIVVARFEDAKLPPIGFAFGFVGAWLRDDPAGGALWSVGLARAVLFVVVTLIAELVDGRLR